MKLTNKQKILNILKSGGEYHYDAIAEILNIPPAQANTYVRQLVCEGLIESPYEWVKKTKTGYYRLNSLEETVKV